MDPSRDDRDPITFSWSRGAARWSIVVHGGAGDVAPARIPLHVAGCARAAAAGAEILANGGTAIDAVQRAVEVLEDDPLFNAGTGACLDEDGHIALDASIMEGTGLRAGAVCALPPFFNPIAIARKVMDATRHVLLASDGAARFALAQGFERADEEWMITPHARSRWQAARAKDATESWAGGTVGAVARDDHGRVASATSTGGMVNKMVGRVGDSPILGAGTYADDEAGACSTTGHGEAMMRVCLAKTAVDGMRGGDERNAADDADAASRADRRERADRAERAVRAALTRMHAKTGERGGAIVVARDGALGVARTTKTMSWAAISDGDQAQGS